MCLTPKTIKNNSRFFDYRKSYKPTLTIPCGHCAECLQAKENEYMCRSFYEYEDTKKASMRSGKHCISDGFTFFETLTWNDDYLPRFHGVPCFSREHFRSFMKKLRVYLERRGLTDGKLKFFAVCEYGGQTYRPHMHVIFYSTIKGLSPWVLKYLIRKSWIYGFTDNTSVLKRIVNGLGALNYVAKYINKDHDFTSKLQIKCGEMYNLWQKNLQLGNIEEAEKFKCLYEAYQDGDKDLSIAPFHRQSLGFGENFLHYNDYETIYKSNCVSFDDQLKTKKFIPIPTYLKRKLWYTQKYEMIHGLHYEHVIKDGKSFFYESPIKTWQLNTEGLKHDEYMLHKGIEDARITLDVKLTNLSIQQPEDYKHVLDLLDGRSLIDYVIYEKFYQGLADSRSHHIDYITIYYDQRQPDYGQQTGEGQRAYNIPVDHKNYYIDSDGYLCDKVYNCRLNVKYTDLLKHTINEDSYWEFHDFDKLTAFLNNLGETKSKGLQARYTANQERKSRAKLIKKQYGKKNWKTQTDAWVSD